MEIVIIEKTAFDMLLAGVKALEDRVRALAEKGGDRRLAEWMDTEDVCRMLSITPKTLQAMRDRHGIAKSDASSITGRRMWNGCCPVPKRDNRPSDA